MPEPIRLLDGPGVDAASAKLRVAGIEVQIVAPTKTLQLWRYVDGYARLVDAGSESAEADAIRDEMDGPWLDMGEEARDLWRRLLDALHRHPWIDPDIVELCDEGLTIEGSVGNHYGSSALGRLDGQWVLAVPSYGSPWSEWPERPQRDGKFAAMPVSDRFAAAWVAEFGGDEAGGAAVRVQEISR